MNRSSARSKITELAWVTCAGTRGHDTDEPLALAALTEVGVTVDVVDWDDPDVEWARYPRVVMRSAWDYPERLDEFVAWLTEVDAVTELLNPLPVMAWSLDKHYLSELGRAGVSVIPSTFVEPGRHPVFPSGRSGFVVKPAVGAGSRDVVRYPATPRAHERAAIHVAALHEQDRVAIVQPALSTIAELGEWPMIFLGGAFSHAANRRVALADSGSTGDFLASEQNFAATATPAMLAVAQAAIDHVHAHVGPTAYARVDVVLDDDRLPVVMEVELVEPSLFLEQHPPAAARLAHVVTG
jgi:glutathione synthase/RimK-type ligase-like ATP-grasp enzyme